jgi:glutamate-ammonia-ligase adenylyltransferase
VSAAAPSPQVAALLEARRSQLAERAPATRALLERDPALAAEATRVLVGSDFVHRCLVRDDALLAEAVSGGSLHAARSLADYRALVAPLARADAAEPGEGAPEDEATYGARLRMLRRREMARIAWRELAGLATVEQTLRETSAFAEAVIDAATLYSGAQLARRHGVPQGPDAGLVVLGMGKLGGGELNFSSDVDLVFLYAAAGDTSGPASLAHEEFYLRQGRMLIRLLDAVTDEGRVFRVDMRLRPFGDSGPLVASFAFFEDYMQAHGRDWERYAWVKARAMSGAVQFEPLRESVLRPFVYRRYLDFGVFESLREMKALISREVARRELADNLKLGAGGIREIEFIVQAFQLVRGGEDRQLREPSLLTVLPRLDGAKLLPERTVGELSAAYGFLRRAENAVQMLDDEQVHSLPEDPLARERIALALGLPDVAALESGVARHRAIVGEHFAALFASSAGRDAADGGLDLAPLWEAAFDRESLLARMQEEGFDSAGELLGMLEALRDSPRLKRLDESGRRRLEVLLEKLLEESSTSPDLAALRRLFAIIEAIGKRSSYFSLLTENPQARALLLRLCGQGEFLAAQVARTPSLLDELTADRWSKALPDRAALDADLTHRLEEVPPDDVEREVEALCRFKQAAVFRVALADLMGGLPLMQVSDRLTEIAELIVQRTLELAWRQMSAQLGEPHCSDEGGRRPVRVAALAYGKFGGRELGYGSDLDLVFLHDSAGEQQETDRESPVDNQVFFLRFAQRLLHLLTVHSAAGRLYEVDVRLRPSGKGGMLVTSIDAFREYQYHEAWTWEHQALLHARSVAGDAPLMARIEQLRIEVLRKAVRRDDLAKEVAQMRERMRRELSDAKPGRFDMKQDRGGIADIEFLAQYWALRWADEYPPVAHYSDTIRQLESVASANLVPQATVDVLVDAYRQYRQQGHRLSLENQSGVVDADLFEGIRAKVAAIWRETFGSL